MTAYRFELKIEISGALPSANEYIHALARNRYLGGAMKRESTELVAWTAKSQFPNGVKEIDVPVFIEFHWYCKNKKKDPDNVAFAKKFIFDGLQVAGILQQDTWKSIIGFSDHFYIDKINPRVVAIIKY